MTIDQDQKPWMLETLGDMTPAARAAFYDDLSDDDPKQHFWGNASDPRRFENPRLEVGLLLDTGEIKCCVADHGVFCSTCARQSHPIDGPDLD